MLATFGISPCGLVALTAFDMSVDRTLPGLGSVRVAIPTMNRSHIRSHDVDEARSDTMPMH